MPKYLTVDPEVMLTKYAHITDEQIATDIRETEVEISNYTRLMAAEQEIADVHPDLSERKIADLKARARPWMIEERQGFVAFLRNLQAVRSAAFDAAQEGDKDGK